MNITGREKKRAANIIWCAAEDYSIHSPFQAFDDRGKAEIYWNMIIGLVHRYYDYDKFEAFFRLLDEEPEAELFINLTWLGLESAVFQKACPDRPVLPEMRQEYAQQSLARAKKPEENDLYGSLYLAQLGQIIGLANTLKAPLDQLLAELQFDSGMDEAAVIARMDRILEEHFGVTRAKKKLKAITRNFNRTKIFHFGQKSVQSKGLPYIKRISIGSAEKTDTAFEEDKPQKNKLAVQWFSFRERSQAQERQEIVKNFGESILDEAQVKDLEAKICLDDHQSCHLHVTRGDFAGEGDEFHHQQAQNQRIKNQQYHEEHLARINNSINRLTHKIQNTILVNFQSPPAKSIVGELVAGQVWRTSRLGDGKVFLKTAYDELGDISVDLLLDASASQISRQEIISAQGYIIAESLSRCQIPVKVYSFCSRLSFTVLNLFRDYKDRRQNQDILNYYAAGYNRDGLAIRTAVHMMEKSNYEHKILIVLSDGKPNDVAKIAGKGLSLTGVDYSDQLAVADTAQEVRKGRQKGIAILCVFTGRDSDLPAVQTIYGRSMAHIQSPERFADTVGILIQNELTNL